MRLWRASARAEAPALDAFGEIPVCGFVNGLAAPGDGAFLAAAVAREPRLGRWEVARKAKNAVVLFPLLASAAPIGPQGRCG